MDNDFGREKISMRVETKYTSKRGYYQRIIGYCDCGRKVAMIVDKLPLIAQRGCKCGTRLQFTSNKAQDRYDVYKILDPKEAEARQVEFLDKLTTKHTVGFSNFQELLDAAGNYFPTIDVSDPERLILADGYDRYQIMRGDSRRAFRRGQEKPRCIDCAEEIDPGNIRCGICDEKWFKRNSR